MKATVRRVALAIGVAALALPAAAAADQSASALPAGASQLKKIVRERAGRTGGKQPFQLAFQFTTSEGYAIEVIGFGQAVGISVARRSGHSETSYVVKGTVTGERLDADLGKYGRVAMRFRPDPANSGGGCHDKARIVSRRGVFVGEFRFHGEDDYLDVDVHRARGAVSRVVPRCDRRDSSAQAHSSVSHPDTEGFFGPETPLLEAGWRDGVRTAEVGAFTLFSLFVYAEAEESRGRIAIFRHALIGVRSPKVFRANDALTSARLSPPAPFSGTGIYAAGPDGKRTWTGSLTVNFPGAPHYPLTGPPFKARLEKE